MMPCHAQTNAESSAQFAQWGVETLEAIKRDLWIAERGLYAEKAAADGERPLVPAFMWGAGVQLWRWRRLRGWIRPRMRGRWRRMRMRWQAYWVEHNGDRRVQCAAAAGVADRYYDDNAWIVLGLMETLAATGDEKYLERAEGTLRFVLSGEDDALGGGIYWRENRRNSKHTCSNGPAIVGALLLYQKTTDPQHLATAQRLYDWTQSRLQDAEDGLYWDNVRLRGRVDRRKYSYNSALMIRANCLLYEVTGEPKYLAEAQRIALGGSAVDCCGDGGRQGWGQICPYAAGSAAPRGAGGS